MKILVTGFNSFADIDKNPTEFIIDHLKNDLNDNNVEIIAQTLNTSYSECEKTIKMLMIKHNPDKIVCFGLNSRAESILLERIAVNIDDSKYADNNNELRQGNKISENAKAAYFSTLPLEKIYTSLKNNDIPAMFSNHAGTYVCNHLFYTVMHTIESENRNIKAGFIHIPPVNNNTFNLEILYLAVDSIIKSIA